MNAPAHTDAFRQPPHAATRFGRAWLALTGALIVHVTDEAFTDFLSVYNPAVLAIRERIPFLPLRTFSFREWILGLSGGIVLLLVLSPLACRGSRWLALVAMPFSVLMVANALGHIGSSAYSGRLMPGIYSSPILLLAAVLAFVHARQVLRTRNEMA